MADPIISAVGEKLADFLSKQAKKEIDLLTGVEREAQNLVNTLKMIQAVLADAEQRMIRDETVKAWLHDLEDLSYEIDDVLDEWNYMILKRQIEGSSIGRQLRVCSFIPPSSWFCFKQVFVRRDIALKIKELNEKLDLIEKRKIRFGFITSIGVASSSQEWKRVRVLDLKECDLKELPMEIGNLIHLRYLRMKNCQLRELPRTVYDLYNLQTLDILDCSDLLELPRGIEKLTKLRHLAFDNKYPVGIEKLTCLQTLGYVSVGKGFNKFGCLKNLNQIRGGLIIEIKENLEDATDITDAGNADLKSKIHIQSLTLLFRLSAEDVRVKEDVMEALEPPPNLKSLSFSYYRETRLPTWMTTSLNNLTSLNIFFCSRLTSLPPLGILPSLEQLEIFGLDELKIVDLSFFGIRSGVVPDVQQHATLASPTIGFPKLIELTLDWCPKWEEWEDIDGPEDEVDAIPILPRLRRLIIDDCPKLRVVPHRLLRKASSSLECIKFHDKTYDDRSAILSFLAEQEEEEAAHKRTEETPHPLDENEYEDDDEYKDDDEDEDEDEYEYE